MTHLSVNDALKFSSIQFKVNTHVNYLSLFRLKVKARRGLNDTLKLIPFRIKSRLAFSLNDALKFILLKLNDT